MHENEKLADAEARLRQMATATASPQSFVRELRAFLSEARSVLLYALEEANPKIKGKSARVGGPGGVWYDSSVTSDVVIAFLRDKRNLDVHEKPVRPDSDVLAVSGHAIAMSLGIALVRTESNGLVSETLAMPATPASVSPSAAVNAVRRYFFADWSGPEDVATLCRRYLQALRRIVDDGVKQGVISG